MEYESEEEEEYEVEWEEEVDDTPKKAEGSEGGSGEGSLPPIYHLFDDFSPVPLWISRPSKNDWFSTNLKKIFVKFVFAFLQM